MWAWPIVIGQMHAGARDHQSIRPRRSIEAAHGVAVDVPGSLRSIGWPLEEGTRRTMEARFGADFSRVRVHTDEPSARVAQSFGAAALTVGEHMSFGPSRYAPGTATGNRLIAHELAHVVQQRRGGPVPPMDHTAPHETAAERSAEQVMSGQPANPVGAGTGVGVACQPAGGGGVSGLPALSPDELLGFSLSQRGFGTSRPGPVSIDPNLVGRPTGYGYRTYAAIQIIDRQGNQVRVSIGAYLGRGTPHGEQAALSALRAGLPPGADVAGGKMMVAVEQLPCAGCDAGLAAAASELGLSELEIYVPARASMTAPGMQVSPKTASTSTFQGGRPVTQAQLVKGQTLVPRSPGALPEGPPSGAAGAIRATAPSERPPTVVEPEPAPETRPAAQGEGGIGGTGLLASGIPLLAFGIPLLAGLAAEPAIRSRMEERREKTGWAPESLDYFDESGSRILAATRYLAAPTASATISAADRFNISVLRQRLRERADQTPPGEMFSITWMVQVGMKQDVFLHPVPDISPTRIVYKKDAKGRWLDVSVSSDEWPTKAPIPYAPDLNRIIDPARSDDEINTLLRLPPRMSSGPRAGSA